MVKRAIVFMLLSLFSGILYSGTTGKIAGVVKNKETGETLAGANIIVMGTYLGAASDADGNFVILNAPVGQHSLKVTYMGFRDMIRENLWVSVDLTTDLIVDMVPKVMEGEPVIITAERPLVNKNITNETHLMSGDDIVNLPLRNYAGIVGMNTGVVSARADLYVRGGRSDEIAYYVDGIYNNDLRTGARVGELPINSIKEISYQAGGFNAEYGFANSGIIITSSKGGSEKYSLSGEVLTDEFLSKTEKKLGAYSYGQNVYSLTASGPVPLTNDKISLFVSAEKTFNRDRAPSSGTHPVLDGNFTDEEISMRTADLILARIPEEEWILPVKNVYGPLPSNSLDQWSFNSNVDFDLNPVNFRIGGNGTVTKWHSYRQFEALANSDRVYKRDNFNYSVYGKISHMLGKQTFYEATGYYSAFGNEVADPIMGRHMADYGDQTDFNENGLLNPAIYGNSLVVSSATRLGTGIFNPPGYPMYQYELNRSNVLGAKFDLSHQIGKTHEIKIGYELRYNTMRRYALTRPWALAGLYANNPNVDPREAYRAAYTENYGYPINFKNDLVNPAKTLDSGLDDAKHPILGSFYLQDKIELSDLVFNIGLRADYIDANDKKPKDPYNIVIKDGMLDPSQLVKTKSYLTFSPRLGVSFPVTDRTVFHTQYGVFIQQPELQYLYTGWDYYAGQMLQGNQVNVGNPDLKPLKTTSYEIGIGQQISDNSSLSITAYYKEITDNVVLKNRVLAKPGTYAQYQNGDYGNVKGLSLTYKLRRSERISGTLSYTLQNATGTGSTADGNFYVTWIGQEYYPVFVSPLDFDQRHTFNANFDFKTYPKDGPSVFGSHIFGNMGLNLLVSVGSGFPYTPKRVGDTVFSARFATAYPVAAINSAYTDWTENLSLRLDKRFVVGGVDLNFYLLVRNLLDTKLPFNRKNEQQAYTSGIYEATGRPDDNGWLNTVEGKRWIENNNGLRAEQLYQAFTNSPSNWQAPRQIQLGLRFTL